MMQGTQVSLVQTLLEDVMCKLRQSVADILSHGFDLWIQCSNPDYLAGARAGLANFETGKEQPVVVLQRLDQQSSRGACVVEAGSPVCRYLVITDLAPSAGLGFVHLQDPITDSDLPPVPRMVARVLEHFDLEHYLDLFCRDRVVLLRDVLKSRGLGTFVDAVVEVAKRSGLDGEDVSVNEKLRTLAHPPPTPAPPSVRGGALLHADLLFQFSLSQEHPHRFVKVALSSWLVHDKGCSVSQASRVLGISRATVQQHLRLAEKQGVERVLGGSR